MNQKKFEEITSTLPKHVQLIAVSKNHTKEEIDQAHACGATIFGENRVQEIKEKYDPNYHWHMIGHLQRNKVKDVVPLVDMIQSLDSLRLAEEIEKQCAKIDKVMPCLVEINISREVNKTGIYLEECESFIKQCASYPHIDIQGLMCVGPLDGDDKDTEECFERMHLLFKKLVSIYGEDKMKYLSMGMSQDYPLAIQHGSNMIRLGTIIFGKRKYNK